MRNNKVKEVETKRKRVRVDKDTEIEIVNNAPNSRIIFNNPKMFASIDMHSHGDKEYITVADARIIMNTNKKLFESFTLLITDVVDGEYELEDVLTFLGLDKAYKEFYMLNPQWKQGEISNEDIKDFILKSNVKKFEEILGKVSKQLRKNIIETSVVLFKLGEFGDYPKMQVIRKYTKDEMFEDAELTEINEDIKLL